MTSTADAGQFVDECAALDPTAATYVGIAGHDDELADLSPDGFAAREELTRRTLAELEAIEPATTARRSPRTRCWSGSGSTSSRPRRGYDPRDHRDHQRAARRPRGLRPDADRRPRRRANIAARLAGFPAALDGYRATLPSAADAGHVVGERQSPRSPSSAQLDRAGGPSGDFFPDLVAGRRTVGAGDELPRRAGAATAAYAEFGAFLRDELAPPGADRGRRAERYALASRYFLGAADRPRRDLRLGLRGAGPARRRDARGDRIVAGRRASTTRWRRSTPTRRAGSRQGGVPRLDAGSSPTRPSPSCTAPTSTSPSRSAGSSAASRRPATAAIYYTGPSEDFSRPGPDVVGGARGHRPRSPPGARSRPSTTRACPGHHLQVAQTRAPRRAAQPLAAAAVLGAPATARAGRCTPSG